MKKMLIMQYFTQAALLGLFLLGVSGCTQSPSSPAQGGSTVLFKTAIDNSQTRMPAAGGVDSIEVTSAGFFVSNMLFFSNATGDETDVNRSEIILRDEHFILDFESWGKQYIGDRILIASRYRSIRFTMQPAGGSADSLALALGTLYNTFFRSDAGNTVVIRGNIWKNNVKTPFEYLTQLTGNELAVSDSSLTVIPEDLAKEVDIQLRTYAAFTNSAGQLMDPRDSRNASTIDANLKTSLKAVQFIPGS